MSAHRRARRRSARGRALRLVLALALVALTAVVGAGSMSSPATAAAVDASPVTKAGTGNFSGLKVTVAQTRDLINQTVEVSWTGGKPTDPAAGSIFATDYVQLMQCWGDDPAGPTREQCEFGARYNENAGAAATTRALNVIATDPDETGGKMCGNRLVVPFKSVTGAEIVCQSDNQFFDIGTSNEVSLARTRADGTGREYFEMYTAREGPGLGCGARIGSTGKLRSCWLVAVPRTNVDVDGTVRSGPLATNGLQSSPLSTSNWKNRIAIPLEFQPATSTCAISTVTETPTAGHELVTEAVSRWLPTLCDSKTVIGFSQISPDIARTQLVSDEPELAFMTEPPTDVPSNVKPVYAPVTISGVTIAFNVARRYQPDAPDDLLRKDGQRLPQMNLTPRLVAKLLSQSYRTGTDLQASYLKANPIDLVTDPDFLAVNPDYRGLSSALYIPDILTPFGGSDAAEVLWEWVKEDKQARAFLDGTADPWGMKVNKHYKGLALPVEDFPKADLFCADKPSQLPLCTLDAHPYTTDMHEAARSIGRGDSQRKTNWSQDPAPGVYKKLPLYTPGETALLAVTDTATAARYSLPTARLLNASGKFVAPTTATMLAGLKTQKAGATAGVLQPNPAAKGASVYPLTLVTYAATNPAVLKKDDRTRYADVLRYAADDGQEQGVEPGDLPYGYAPLTETLRKQTRAAATAIENWKAAPAGSDAVAPGGGSTPGSNTPASPVGAETPATTADPVAQQAITADRNPIVLSSSSSATPWFGVGATRYVVLVVLVIGILAAVAGPLLLRLARSPRG